MRAEISRSRCAFLEDLVLLEWGLEEYATRAPWPTSLKAKGLAMPCRAAICNQGNVGGSILRPDLPLVIELVQPRYWTSSTTFMN